jgi:hypothetical protein
LEGGGITQVAGPLSDADMPPRSNQPLWDRISGYFNLIAHPSPIRVYAIPSPLPRVFAARDLKIVADDLSDQAFLALVAEHAPGRTVIVSQRFADRVQKMRPSLRIKEFELVRDGVDIQVEASGNGLLVVNIPYTPFWKANFGKNGSARPFPVNINQMAVSVPAGTARVTFRYERQLLRQRIVSVFQQR